MIKKIKKTFGINFICIFLCLIFLNSANFADQNSELRRALTQVGKAQTLEQLLDVARSPNFQNPFVIEGIWYSGALLSLRSDFAKSLTLQKKVLKAIIFATLLELALNNNLSKWPENEKLFTFGPLSLKALREYGNLFEVAEPTEVMLRHSPQLKKWTGIYRYLKIVSFQQNVSVLFEKSDTLLGNIGNEWKISKNPFGAQKGMHRLPSKGESFIFHLEAMNFIIMAGKAFLCLKLQNKYNLSENYKHYSMIVAANSLYYASKPGGHKYSKSAEFYCKKAINSLERYPNKYGRWLTTEKLETRLTAIQFFAKALHAALEKYQKASNSFSRTPYRVYGEWGSAICLLGLKNSRSIEHFNRLTKLLIDNKSEFKNYKYFLSTLVEIIGPSKILGKTEKEDSVFAHIRAWEKMDFTPLERYYMNLDLLRQLTTIDNYYAWANLLMREIKRIHFNKEKKFRPIELHYLKELGSFMRDMFSLISWEIGDHHQPVLRIQDITECEKDFAPTWRDKYFSNSRLRRYGMSSPEEDRATCIELYFSEERDFINIIDRKYPIDILKDEFKSQAKKNDNKSNKLIIWVKEQISNPPSNIEPLLKLIWVEWFFAPFIPLNNKDLSMEEWIYNPKASSPLTSIQNIQRVLGKENSKIDGNTREIWKIFHKVHKFLVKLYRKHSTVRANDQKL